jgi:hypothetical protein
MSRSLTKISRLGVLSREICSDYESLLQLLERTRRNCNEVISETILLGTKLAEAKTLAGHGNWLEWLAKHCPQITARTAQNYIRLSNTKHVSHLEKGKSLRQAYIAVGILGTDDESEPVVEALPQCEIQGQLAASNEPADSTARAVVVEAEIVEPPNVERLPAAVETPVVDTASETPVTRVKGKVGDLMQCLKPLDAPCRKRVAVHLKPLVIFYHRFGRR